MPYRRIVTGVSTTIRIVHEFNRLLVKYEGRILSWALAELTAEQTQQIADLFELIHAVDAFLQVAPDD